MITAAISGTDRLAARFATMPAALHRRLAETVARLGQELQGRVRQDKLGGAVLRHRSGRLADGIQVTIPAHEIVPHGAHVPAVPWHGRQRFFRRVAIPAVTLPERSFLHTALAEMTPEIRTALAEAARDGLRE